MKKIYTARQLPAVQPDRCELCPLIGKVPKDERVTGERKGYYCLGIYQAEVGEDGQTRMTFPRLASKGITSSAADWKSKGHLLHRPCDYTWDAWMTLPGLLFGMPVDVYTRYRLPYEQEQQLKNFPKFKFRIRNRKEKKDGKE